MNVKLLKNLVFLGLLSFSVFPSFAVSKIIPDGTIIKTQSLSGEKQIFHQEPVM